jgi:prolyl oligopeptidase
VRVPTYPDAPRLDTVDDYSGVPVADPYRYLEVAADDRTVAWSAAQAELFEAERSEWSRVDDFRTHLTALMQGGFVSPPYFRRDRCFVMKRTGDQQFGVLWTIDPDGTERVLLDPMQVDPSGLTTLDSWQPSKEGDLLAYQLSESGTEESVVRVMRVDTGEVVDGPIDRARYSPIAWLPGGDAYYYVRRLDPAELPAGEEQFHRRVWLHRVGTDPSDDVEIFGAGRAVTNYYGVSVSLDGRWLQISSSEGTEPRNDLWIADLTTSPREAPELVEVQVGVDAQTSLHIGRDGKAYVGTDRDAPRARLAVVDPASPGVEHWVDLVPEDDEAVLEDFAIADGDELDRPLLLVARSRHGLGELTVHDLATGELLSTVPTPGVGTLGGLVERPDGGPLVWFVYTDYTTQPHVYQWDARSGEVTLHAAPPGVVEVPPVVFSQVTYTSADGTTVRMFVLSPSSEPDRPRPTILYGYGGFGISMTPSFSATALAWVAAGGVYAIPGIRGGGEEGEEWRRAGMLGHKQNAFDDFHAAAQWLIDGGWTTRDQLAISGGSNGGLLVGTALTQRPDLYGTVICVAPLLDMVRYVKSGLGATWTVDYGDPEVPEELGWLLGYSPYHHVVDGTDYPATMFMVFDNDTRTDPMHGRKMCAALQHATSSERPIVIRQEGEVGHGARAVARGVDEQADLLAFAARWTGLAPE